MTGNDYQKLAMRTCNIPYGKKKDMLRHAVFGLASEAGEVAGILQKEYQGHEFDESHIKKELGDCLWMIAEACTVLADIQWTLDSNSSEKAYGTTKRLVITCNYGSNPSCKLSRWETAGMLCGSNPHLSNSTAKIKHCYGVIAGALSIVGTPISYEEKR